MGGAAVSFVPELQRDGGVPIFVDFSNAFSLFTVLSILWTHPLTSVAYRSNSWDAAKPVSWLHFAAKTSREAHCTDIST